MKKIILAAITAFTFIHTSYAQENTLSPILTAYYGVKDALVSGDANAASAKASELLAAISHVDMTALPAKQHTVFMSVKDKLSFDARHISEMKKIDHQREHFASLSNNMVTLAKGAHLSQSPIYQDYCPMKKSSWLSQEQPIKNPYYGSSMLTCGKVTETIQP